METFSAIKAKLEKQKQQVERELVRLKKDDPFLAQDRSVIDEPGTESMEEDGHRRIQTNILETQRLLTQIKRALDNITEGTYGTCENCGKPIDQARLDVFPMATLCVSCERKREAKR